MKAVAKTRPAAGLEIIDVEEPQLRPGCVKLRVEHGSVCGTDLHIYNWDPWAANRIHPPRVVGHEFCGTVVEVAADVTTHQVGDYVASESHIVCNECKQCQHGQGHVCTRTQILGVDVDGGFGRFAVVPAQNARQVPASVPRSVASMLDALGNGVHTAMAGPVEGRTILITGMGPIGLFAVAVCKALGASQVVATEVSPFRIGLAEKLGVDTCLNPRTDDVDGALSRLQPDGFDATLEMSGHPTALPLAIRHTRPGGRISMLGVYPDRLHDLDVNMAIFKGLDMQGIVGRRLWDTWNQMNWLLTEKHLNVLDVITHQVPYTEYDSAFEAMRAGTAGKIVLDFD